MIFLLIYYAFACSPKDSSSALSRLQSGANLERILNEAKPLYHKCLATFNTYRDSVREEIQGHEQTTGLKVFAWIILIFFTASFKKNSWF